MSINPGPKTFGHIRIKSVCDECGRARSSGNHEKCSKKRQVRTASLAGGQSSAMPLKRLNAVASHADSGQ